MVVQIKFTAGPGVRLVAPELTVYTTS
jgi:hypothetical protein